LTALPGAEGERVPRGAAKVFGIGLSRTGTTSLTRALELLGYRAKHYPTAESHFDEYDALTDTPVTVRWRELDERYPDARFILTVRAMEPWLASCRAYFAAPPPPGDELRTRLRTACYGTVVFEEDRFRAAMERHSAEVTAHFASRPGRLLTVDLCAGAGWDALCAFLDKARPEAPFPHENKIAEALATRATTEP
jgi:hypothetical protein